MKRNHTHFGTTLGSVLLAVLMLVAVSPVASAAGPLFHNWSYPEFRLQTVLPEPTIEGLAEANAYETLLEKYDGFGVETFANSAYVDTDSYSFFYGTKAFDFFCNAGDSEEQPDSATLITETDVFRMSTKEDGSREFGMNWTADPDWEETYYDLRGEAMALDEESLRGMEILSAEDNGDSTLTLVLGEPGADTSLAAGTESVLGETVPAEVLDPYVGEYMPGADDWSYGDSFAYDYDYDGWDYENSWVYDDALDFDDVWDYDDAWGYDDDWRGPGGYEGFRNDGFRPGRHSDRWYDDTAEAELWGAGPDEFYNEPDSWYDIPAAEETLNDTLYEEQPTAAGSSEPTVLTVLTVDAETLEILKAEQSLILEDGSEELLMVQLMSYTEPDLALYREMTERTAPYLNGTLNNPRTVTVIYNPGTEEEVICTHMTEKGDLLYTSFAYGYWICADEQGTPFEGSDGQSDVTIYAFPEGKVFTTPEEETAEPEMVTLPVPVVEPEAAAEEETAEPEMMTLPVPVVEPEAAAEEENAEPETAVWPVPVVGTVPAAEEEKTEEEMPVVIVEGSEYISEGAAPDEPVALEEALREEPMPEEILAEATDYSFDEANRAIFEANRLDAILNRHESVEYRQIFGIENAPEWPYYVYETRDMAYTENDSISAYVGNGRYYELMENAAGSEFYYVFDFSHHYDPSANIGYEIVPQTYEEWWDESLETAADCYVEGNEIHLISVTTPEGSREIMEDYLQMPYNGEIISAERVADAETYELRRFVFRMEKDGEITEPLSYEVAYDVEQPRACRNLRAFAERDAAQVATVRLVMNPGTEIEEEQTMVVPIGSNVVYFADEWMEMFEDPECTVPAEQWDKLSDHTYYMRPSGENR